MSLLTRDFKQGLLIGAVLGAGIVAIYFAIVWSLGLI